MLPRPGSKSSLVRRLSKTALSLVIVALVGLAPFQKLLQSPSVEAVVNARVVTLRAPIDGEVEVTATRLDVGRSIARGDTLFRITNRRVDGSRLDDLTRQIEQLKDERPSIAARLAGVRTLLWKLTEQTQVFIEARILQLEARQDELAAELAAAQAKNLEAKTSLDRLIMLANKGWLPKARLDQVYRDSSIAEKLEAAAQKRLEAAGVELAAAQRGVFVGGSTDHLRYMQRLDQLEQQVHNLTETLAAHDRRIMRFNSELSTEEARHMVLAAGDVIAPAQGSVWEILAAPEEQVHRGQDLLRVLDCRTVVVTAIVGEATYKRLRVGSPARFQPRDGREDLAGTIIRLSDAPAALSNLAIQPSVPARGSYHVTVAVPKLAQDGGCMVGRTGRVVLHGDPMDAVAATAQVAQ